MGILARGLLMKLLASALLVACFTFPPLTVRAEETVSTRYSLAQFRFAQYSLFQMSKGLNSVFSSEISWNPEYVLSEQLSLVGHLGFAPLVNRFGGQDSLFINSRYLLYLAGYVGAFGLEMGAGGESWFMNPAVNSFVAASNLQYKFRRRFVYVIDSIFAGYSAVFQSPFAHELHLGIQIII